MKFMLDTNICVYAIQGGNEHLDRRLDDCEVGDLVMSAITLGELEAGYAKSEDPDGARREAASALADIKVVPFDEGAARMFGRIQSEAPTKRGAYDRQIAAHAASLGLVLVTNDEKDFDGIPSVAVENWAKPPKAVRQS